MTLYAGSDKIRDTDSYGVYKGSQPIRAIYKGSQKLYWQQLTTTFNASGSFQVYTVPANVTKLMIDCVASKGLNFGSYSGGSGGRVQCILNVTPNQTLYIYVGATGTSTMSAVYNASDIRTNNSGVTDNTSLNSRLIVAGGGGNAAKSANGGAGGSLIGGNGGSGNGTGTATGGTQTAGGQHASASAFASNGSDGTFGLGGNGGNGNAKGGAGGAGWYGGGGGSYHSYGSDAAGGGGGGSSYTNSTYCSNVTHTQGYRNGAGYITITEIG